MVRFDVVSDIQGDLDDLAAALEAFAELGRSDALLINGDLTQSGQISEYESLVERLAATRHPPALFTIGNHDFYNGEPSDTSIDRFLHYTGMPALYSAHNIRGVRVLRLGTIDGSEKTGHCVILGDEQLDWLAAELDSAPPDHPVIVMSHHALPHTVSGTYEDPITQAPNLYLADYAESDRLLDILGAHPQVLMLSGHTHWSLYRPDWFARRTVPGGHPLGFAAVNTGAVQRGFGPDGRGGETPLDTRENQGLRIVVHRAGIHIHALDFRRHKEIQSTRV